MAAYDPTGLPDMSDDDVPVADANGNGNGNGNGEYQPTPNAGEDDDEEDYDPSFGFENIQAPPSQATQQSKPLKTVGGFLVEESDEEEDMPRGIPQAQPNGSTAETQAEEAGHVPLASSATLDSAAQPDRLNGAATTADPDTAAESAVSLLPTVSTTESTSAVASAASTTASLTAQQPQATAVSPAPPATTTSNTPMPATNGEAPAAATTQRLPHDVVGRLEDRIKDDPKCDVDAWWELIAHYRAKTQVDNVRKVYERMLEVWPTNPTIFLQLLTFEYEQDFASNRPRIESVFSTSLPRTPALDLWNQYLSYLRRVFPLVPDPSGESRAVISQAFEATLAEVGDDPESANLWREYIDFIKSSPGVLGGTGWQDLQKVDSLRKAYQRSIKVPSGNVVALWKEYDSFENQYSGNKAAGRKVLQEMSPHYMQARTAEKQVSQLLEGLDRKIVPTLPPVEGCEGDDAFAAQVQRWKAWVDWEISDPLILKDEDIALYRKRILFVYKQACTFLRFWPRIWYEAASWCFEQLADATTVQQGETFLEEGLKANPESVLLTLKKADRVEEALEINNAGGEEIAIANGEKLDAVFEPCLKALYDIHKKLGGRRDRNIAEVRAYFASLSPEVEDEKADAADSNNDDEDEEGVTDANKPKTRAEQEAERIEAVKTVAKAQIEELKRTISYLWIAKMRAFRRIQGQGAPGKSRKGFRGVFSEARPRGQLGSEVYVANALMEWHCYKDPSALKIFERGLKLFPVDEGFALEYLRFLVECVNDVTNARVVFETVVGKILGKVTLVQERRERLRGLLGWMYHFESRYGDLAQVRKLEARMRELFGAEPGLELERFAERFEVGGFDGVGVQLPLSEKQIRPKTTVTLPPTVMVEAAGADALRLGPGGPYMASPKRPLDDLDTDAETPRKFMRAESPLKGITNRKPTTTGTLPPPVSGGGTLTTQTGSGGFMTKNYVPATSPAAPGNQVQPPAPLPREITLLLQVLPNGAAYRKTCPQWLFDPGRVLGLLKGKDLEGLRARLQAIQQVR